MAATTIKLKIYDPQVSWVDQVRAIQVIRLGCHERYRYESLYTCNGIFTLFKDTQKYFVENEKGLVVATKSRYYLVSRDERVTEISEGEELSENYLSIDEVDAFARERLLTHSPH